MALRWVSCEAATGRIIADLPDLVETSALKVTIGAYETASVELPIPTAPDDWERATLPGGAVLIAVDEDANGSEVAVWGGLVTKRRRYQAASGSIAAALGLVTGEGYFTRRYVGDKTYTAVDQNTIAADLVASYAGFSTDTAASAMSRDRTYRDDEDATVYTRLTELSGVIGGPEWTVRWMRLTGPVRFAPVFVVRDRLGAGPLAGLRPNAQFTLPGNIIDVESVEDYSHGRGANDVQANGSNQGDMRPQSPHQIAAADERPKFEYRWQPSSSIELVDTLTSHAQRALAVMKDGSNAVVVTAREEMAPKFGIDYQLGDDIAFDVTSPAWPSGMYLTGRCIGFQRSGSTVSPVMAAASLEDGGSV